MEGKTEDKPAITRSSPSSLSGDFIGSPEISDGTGDIMAKCLFKLVNDFELLNGVLALVFDTTASNTGWWKGSSTIFEAMLEQPWLWLACRHNISELFIKHVSIAICGEMKGLMIHSSKNLNVFFVLLTLIKMSLEMTEYRPWLETS